MVVAGSPDPRQHPFGSGQSSLSGRLSEPLLAEEPAPRSPGFPLPFGDRHSLLGSSCARWRIGVPHETDTTGLGALCTPGTVVRSRPTKFARAAPVASQRPAPTSLWNIPPS